MSYVCENCGKGIQVGHHIRHHKGVAGGRWKRKAQKIGRLWLPNLHYARVVEGGKVVRRRLCSKCLRRAERPAIRKKEIEKMTEVRTKKLDDKKQQLTLKKEKQKEDKEQKLFLQE